MTQFATPMMPKDNSMKKKAIAVVVAVIIGHTGVMWALSHMKTLELKPVEKEPLKVRFVQVVQEAEPIVEPKKEPIPEPVVEPTPVKETKVIATKKKETVTDKKVRQDDTLEKQERAEKLKQEQLRQEQLRQEQLKQEQLRQEQLRQDQLRQDQLKRDQEARDKADRERNTVKTLSIGQISWSRSPRPSYTNRDLQGQTRSAMVLIEADVNGKITSAVITQSTGISTLDDKILRAVRSAKFKPYKENGVAYPIKVNQPFELTVNPNG